MSSRSSPHYKFWIALVMASSVGIGLFGIGVFRNHTLDFWYLPYNLLLASVPLFLSFWLRILLKRHSWRRLLPFLVTAVWIVFLPNSFYIVTDFIHLIEYPRVDIVQDVVMLMQFSVVGLILGFTSLFIVHQELIKRLTAGQAGSIAAFSLLACSFAIYLGRDLRWNSWDIIVQPLSVVTDSFTHLFNPAVYPQTLIMTLSFFAMLGSLYVVIWHACMLVASSFVTEGSDRKK